MSDDRFEGLSPAGPAEDESVGLPGATPPLTDGHTASEGAGSQVLLARCNHCWYALYDKVYATLKLCELQSAACL